MRFIDSNVLAYAFYQNEHTDECQKVIKEGGLVDIFNLIEAFFIIEKETGSREVAQKSIKGLLKLNFQIVDVDSNLLFEALKKVNHIRLSIFDTIHYCCALLSNCDTILSYDPDFDNLDIPRKEP